MSERANPRLLILDDEPAFGIILSRIAERTGWAPEMTTDAATFQREFAAARPDAVVLDLNLGASDGSTQLRFLHDARFAGGIVVMSGADEGVIEAARALGRSLGLAVVGTIAKPAENETIRDCLVALARSCVARSG